MVTTTARFMNFSQFAPDLVHGILFLVDYFKMAILTYNSIRNSM